MTSIAAGGGMMHPPRGVQIALLSAIAGGLVARGPIDSFLVVLAASLIGGMLSPMPRSPVDVVTSALLAGLTASAVSLAGRRRGMQRGMTWFAVALVVVNMWATVIRFDSDASLSQGTDALVFDMLRNGPMEKHKWTDESFFYTVLQRVREGRPYYASYAAEYRNHQAEHLPVSNPWDIREPLSFRIWASLPQGGAPLPVAYLVLVTVALLSVPFALKHTIRLPFAIPSVCAVAAYSMEAAMGLSILRQTAWVGVLLIPAVALLSNPASARWRLREAGAAGIALVAALMRELSVPFLIAGMTSALVERSPRSKSRRIIWAAALIAFACAYAVHVYRAGAVTEPSGRPSNLTVGGLAWLIAGLTGPFHVVFGGQGHYVLVFALVGLLGVIAIPPGPSKTFVVTAVGLPLGAFLLIGNGAVNLATGLQVNYWGEIVLPLLLMFAPAALSWLPGLSPP